MGGRAPSVLTIDTEGWDVLALLGAPRTLPSVDYVEFEYHNVGMWKRFNLQPIIEYMYNLRFDCFWPIRGKLVPITGCWFKAYENHCWSNVMCAQRGTLWHSVLTEQV